LTGELFRRRSGANLHFIYYPGAAQALNDVIAGRVQVFVNNLAGMLGAMSNHQVRPLAVTFPSRLPDFPDIPSAAETVPDFNVSGWTMLVAPRGTPETVIQKIHEDVRAIQEQSEFKKQLVALGVYQRPMSPPQMNEFIAAEQRIWRPLVRELVSSSR
jgi:tripartite-type tricarboxylate transporter receptor subunit TctC